MAVTKTLTFDESEWYELVILLERGIDRIHLMNDTDDETSQKWISRYQRMIKEINQQP